MAITNFGTLKTAVANWFERADMPERIPEFIALATATLNTVIRDSRMVAYADVAVTVGERWAAVPATMLEPIFLTSATDSDKALEQISIQQLIQTRRQMTGRGHPLFFAIVGRRLELCPVPAANGTLELAHYREIPALAADGDTNWLLTSRPDIYLYTALLHGATFLKDEQKVTLYNTLLAQQIQAAVQAQGTIQLDSKEAGPTLTAPRDVRKPG